MTVVHKATASAAGSDPLVFVMSDATVDRYGDIIEPEAWKLASFKRNPIALFGHDSSFVIGTWQDVKVEGGKLLGRLELLRQGISERLDEIRAAVEAGVLRAVSVGFRPTASEPIGGPGGGQRYTGAELLECSLVSIPANPNALAIAKQLHLSDDATRLIFGKSADEIVPIVRRETTGEPALNRTPSRITKMTTLSQRIESAQTELVQLRDDLTAAIDNGGDIDAITGQIEQKDAVLASLRRAEKALGDGGEKQQTITVTPTRVEKRVGCSIRAPNIVRSTSCRSTAANGAPSVMRPANYPAMAGCCPPRAASAVSAVSAASPARMDRRSSPSTATPTA